MSTHFDDLKLTAPDGSSAPEPPGLDEAIFKEVKPETTKFDDKIGVNVPAPRSAVYVAKYPSPPPELNTLVPEDFNLIDFNFNDLNHKKKDEVIKTDNHFAIGTDEPEVNTESKDNKAEKVEKFEQESKSTEAIVVVAATAVTAAVLVSNDEELDKPSVESPVVEEPLKKVSEARKSLEPAKVESSKPAPIIIAEVPKSALAKESVEPVKTETSEVKSAPIIIAEVPKKIETKTNEEKNEVPEVKAAPIIIAEVPQSIVKQEEKVDQPVKIESPEIKAAPIIIAPVPEAVEPEIKKEPVVVEEVTAPPPLPTDTAHLAAVRESLKPSLLPVKPVNGAPSTDPEVKSHAASSPLAETSVTAAELEKLRKELEEQKLALEREIDNKNALQSQIQAMVSKSTAQEEALKYKNESIEQLHSDYLKTNNDLTSARNEREKLVLALAKAEEELAKTSETNAKAYLEKSDEVNTLKDKVAEFAAIIGQKNKEIDSLQRQLDEAKRSNVKTVLDNVQKYEKIEDDLIKMVEEEILRMQDTIDAQREYNAKLQMEVDAEYAYWKRRLASPEENNN